MDEGQHVGGQNAQKDLRAREGQILQGVVKDEVDDAQKGRDQRGSCLNRFS